MVHRLGPILASKWKKESFNEGSKNSWNRVLEDQESFQQAQTQERRIAKNSVSLKCLDSRTTDHVLSGFRLALRHYILMLESAMVVHPYQWYFARLL
jgi:hypothetical protein